MTTSTNTTIDTTIPTRQGPDVATPAGHSGRVQRRSRWLLAAATAAAIAVPVTLFAVRSDDAPTAPVDSPAIAAEGLPASPEDLGYAAEWARRVQAMTPDTVVVQGLPASREDLRYAAQWAQRVEAMTANADQE
jgi:hypothetical protein